MADPKLVDKLITVYENKKVNYLSNIEPVTFPDGLDIEIFDFEALEFANFQVKTQYDKEHVTPFIRNLNKNKKFNVLNKSKLINKKFFSNKDFSIASDLLININKNVNDINICEVPLILRYYNKIGPSKMSVGKNIIKTFFLIFKNI